MAQVAVSLHQVSKKYILHHEKPTLIENILTQKKNQEFWALRNINLTIKPGERVGVIGANGSGKTTLLEMISGIKAPTTGQVQTNGKLASLIEVGAGFHPDLTGVENILLNGLIIGMSKSEVLRNLDSIISFADIKDFIDVPLYTYSEGMKLRLGFSIAIHVDPDILILDENLSFGDNDFQIKAQKSIKNLFHKNKTIILATHWLDFVEANCNRVILLEAGKISVDGDKKVIKKYLANKR